MRHGEGVLLRHVGLQPLFDGQAPISAAWRGRPRECVPRLARDDGGADDRREADVEHVRRLPVPLERQRRERRRRQPFDHAGGQSGEDVGHRHAPAAESVGLVPLRHAVVAGRRVELQAFEIGHGLHRPLREHLHPAAVSPVEQHEALGFDALLQRRRQLLDDVVQLVVRVEEERHVEDVERRIDGAEADDRERRRLQRVEAHLAQHASPRRPASRR